MSLGRPNGNDLIDPEQYISNQAKIEQARKLLEKMEERNRMGFQKYTEREMQQQAAQKELQRQKEELQRKIQEGLEAQRLIQELEKQQLDSVFPVVAPGIQSARIEEVDHSNNQLVASTLTAPDSTSLVNAQWASHPTTQSYRSAPNSTDPYSGDSGFRSEQSSYIATQSVHTAQVHQNPYTPLVNAYGSRQPLQQLGSVQMQQPGQFSSNVTLQQPYYASSTTNISTPHSSQIQHQHQQVSNIALRQQGTGIIRPNSFNVSNVPYLNLTDSEVFNLQRRFDNWRLQAPPGTMDKLHEMIVLYKDSEVPPTTWIYVPSTPGSTRYFRTKECSKFFTMLLQNVREMRATNPIPPMQSVSQSAVGVTAVRPTLTAAQPTQPNIQRQHKPHQPVPSTSTIPSVPSSTSVQPPAISSTTPSGFVRNGPPLNQVDKKHLSKNVLFALGKRSRTSVDPVPNELPTKTHKSEATHANPSTTSKTSPPLGSVSLSFANTPNENPTMASNLSENKLPSNAASPLASTSAPATSAEPPQDTNLALSGPSPASSNLVSQLPTLPLGVDRVVASASSGQYSYDAPASACSATVSYPAVQAHSSIQTSHPTVTTSKQKEPLFLPSTSPERDAPIKQSVKSEYENAHTSTPIRNGWKNNRAYVLLPDPPEYLVRCRQQMSRRDAYDSDTEMTRQGMLGLRTRTSSVSSFGGEEVTAQDLKSLSDYGALSINERSRVAVRLASSRLQELPCRWNGCTAKLNSVKALIRHLDLHKPEPTSSERHFTCRWTQCGRRCSFDERHLEKHATLSLKCAFKGCNEAYRSGTQLLKHFDAKHKMSELKPSAQFSTPKLDAPPPVPGTVPAYLFATRLVKAAPITPERHDLLCRWVVKTIVNSDQEKPTRLRTRKTAKSSNPPMAIPGQEYEFITTRSTRYSSYLSQAVDLSLEDLDSANISKMIDDGLMLWPEEDVDSTAAHTVDDTTVVDSAMMPPPQSAGIQGSIALNNETVPDQRRQEHSSDEDAVVVMLTER